MKKLLITLGIVSATGLFSVCRVSGQAANEYWICAENTGLMASQIKGSPDNPLDGSTQSTFDTNMVTIYNNAASGGASVVHIMAGAYSTKGSATWHVGPNTRLLGGGLGSTVLKLDGQSSSGASVVATAPSLSAADNVQIEVADMTLDCNASNSTSISLQGVNLTGSNCFIKRVRVINAQGGATSGGAAVAIYATGGICSKGNVIEECKVLGFRGGVGTGIAMDGDGSSSIRGIIENCYVDFSNCQTSVFQTGIETRACSDVLIKGNTIKNINTGLNRSNYASTNLTVSHNTFVNCFRSLNLVAGNDHSASVLYNRIIPADQIGTSIIYSSCSDNLNFMGNFIAKTTTNSVTYYFTNDLALNISHNSLAQNVNGTNELAEFYFQKCTNTWVYNNIGADGEFLTVINQTTPPNAMTRKSIAADYAATANDKYIGITATNVTVTLPDAYQNWGKVLVIADESGRTNPSITIITTNHFNYAHVDYGYQSINGAASKTINTQYDSTTLVSDGKNWFAQ
jgi:hypothetical protein